MSWPVIRYTTLAGRTVERGAHGVTRDRVLRSLAPLGSEYPWRTARELGFCAHMQLTRMLRAGQIKRRRRCGKGQLRYEYALPEAP